MLSTSCPVKVQWYDLVHNLTTAPSPMWGKCTANREVRLNDFSVWKVGEPRFFAKKNLFARDLGEDFGGNLSQRPFSIWNLGWDKTSSDLNTNTLLDKAKEASNMSQSEDDGRIGIGIPRQHHATRQWNCAQKPVSLRWNSNLTVHRSIELEIFELEPISERSPILSWAEPKIEKLRQTNFYGQFPTYFSTKSWTKPV